MIDKIEMYFITMFAIVVECLYLLPIIPHWNDETYEQQAKKNLIKFYIIFTIWLIVYFFMYKF